MLIDVETTEVRTRHKYVLDPTNKWGGYLFKCMQCGYHTIHFGSDAKEAFRKLPQGFECEPDAKIMKQFHDAGYRQAFGE